MIIGSKGEDVKKLQQFLSIKADGIYGPKTCEAVKNWQIKNGLSPDGIVGPKTMSAMGLLDCSSANKTLYLFSKFS